MIQVWSDPRLLLMASVTQNFTAADEWYVGEDKVLTYTVKDKTGAIVDVSGWQFEMMLKLKPSNPNILIHKTSSSGISVPAPATGLVNITVSRTDTMGLGAGRYYHGLARVNANNYDIVVDGYADLLRSAAS